MIIPGFDGLEFASLWAFLLLPLPLLIHFLVPPAPISSSAALRIPFFKDLQSKLTRQKKSSPVKRLFIAIITILVWLLLVTAAARPQLVGDTIRQSITGRSLMMAVDISGSMQINDMVISGRSVTRLTAVKAVAGDFISKRKGDRIGLILFGSQAYLQAPLTFDRKTIRTLLNEAELGLAGRETAMGDAIGLAVNALEKNRKKIVC